MDPGFRHAGVAASSHSTADLKVSPLPPAPSGGWLAGWLAGWLVGWLAGWLAGWLVGWLAGWRAGGLAGWLAGWRLANTRSANPNHRTHPNTCSGEFAEHAISEHAFSEPEHEHTRTCVQAMLRYIYIYIYTYIHTYIHTHTHIHTHIHTHTYITLPYLTLRNLT